ncbi:unnamed protein product [Vitrella brassicaformis CCMP3155]|uniref:Uncharacterized protein n=2 Tax=Vitrella brassicaformis TaxID=1169539 RepID=A0A0G4EVI7_VITBC|nr:unnamed protein product [Vitrella brassicaformis CCMP3155]|eukprot:CEM02293.1 unnamed protein product [Vitrella brassicaformis CCMP3155]
MMTPLTGRLPSAKDGGTVTIDLKRPQEKALIGVLIADRSIRSAAMEDDRQLKRSRHHSGTPPAVSSSPAAAAAAAGESSGASEMERVLWQQITDEPGLPVTIVAFLPLYLLVQVSQHIYRQASRQQHHLTISCGTREERSVWQRIPVPLVTQLGALLTSLTSITLRHPMATARWCLDVLVAMVEGQQGGTLQTITIEGGVRLTGAEMQTVARTHPALPAPLDPPPTLRALTTLKGLTGDHQGLIEGRWLMPSLAIVQQGGERPDSLGRLISSSRLLRRVDGSFDGEEWAVVFERIPAAPAGQQGGTLAQLERTGTIVVQGDNSAGVDRLQEVLVWRGCRGVLKQLHVRFRGGYRIGRPTLPVLLSLSRLVGRCCQPGAQLILTTTGPSEFDLSALYADDLPTHPSSPFKSMLQQLAQQVSCVKYVFTQQSLTDPHASPSQAAVDMASSLSFDKANKVVVENAPDFNPPANAPSPHPTIVTHLQPLHAVALHVRSKLGGCAARLFGAKMPKKVRWVDIDIRLGRQEQVGVLTALGREREVGTVGDVDIDQLQLVGAANSLPTIKELYATTRLPDGVQDAGSFVRTVLSSLISHVRGLRSVGLTVLKTTSAQHAAIRTSLVGTDIDGFSITHVRYDRLMRSTTMTAVRNA